MFIQTEATPNPATLKFIPGKPVLDQGTVEFLDPNESKASPLASRLFEIEGVKGVFFGTDFISVTKGDGEWQHLKPAILGAIMEHYLSGEAVTEGERTGSESSEGGEFLRARGRGDGQDHQGAAGDAGASCRGAGRRRHHLPGLSRRRRLSAYARRLLGLPELDGDAPSRHRESAPALHPRGARGAAGLSGRLPDPCLDQLFREARTHNAWQDRDVPDELLHQIVDLLKLGPTSANCSPARFVFVKSPEAKERLKPHLSEGNRDKTMKAPVCAIIGYDLDFYLHLPKLFPHADAKSWFAGNEKKIAETAFRNGTLQGAYLIMAARALGPRLRADVGLRQRRRRSRILRRHQDQIELPLQSRLMAIRACCSRARRASLRRDGAHRLRSSDEHPRARHQHGRLLRRGAARRRRARGASFCARRRWRAAMPRR